jgi:C4-dicarboxylate-specific signal transduction histidine kinase
VDHFEVRVNPYGGPMQNSDGPLQGYLLHLASLGEVFGGFSHEIAQPLNAILIASQVIQLKMQRSALPEEARDFFDKRLEIVSSQVLRATQMVENLRLFADADTPYPEETNIREVFQRIFEFMRTQFVKRGIDIAVHSDRSLPLIRDNLHVIESVLVQTLAYARDSVQTVARWHETQGTPYEKALTVKLFENHGASAVEIEWSLGKHPDVAAMIDPQGRVGLATAHQVLQSMGGLLETTAAKVVTTIP